MTVLQTHSDNPGLRQRFGRFFYAEEVPYGLAIIRILMPLVLLYVMATRWPLTRELYSADGSPSQLAYNFGFGNMLPELPGGFAVALMTALLFFLITSSIGWCTRISLIISTILYTYFNMLDCLGTLTKYSVIASHVMLILSLSNCGSIWSVDSWLKGTRRRNWWPGEPSALRPRSPVWPRRLIQLLIGIVYFGAAITKMHTPEFFTGDQMMYWMRSGVNYKHPLGQYLSLYPAVLVVFAYISIVWEVVFLFLCWKGWGRIGALSLGALFHIMTNLTLGLYIFPMICLTIYASFINEEDVRKLSWRFRRLRRRWRWITLLDKLAAIRPPAFTVPQNLRLPSPVFLGILAAVLAVLGVEIEYQMDPYQMRGPDGPLALVEFDRELAEVMLGPEMPLRLEDKFFAFEVGSILVGNILVNRRNEFRHGETVIAQCSLSPPHEDMWVECNLYDANDRILDRVGTIVPREMLRSSFFYPMNESLEPGDYYLVLQTGGQEITRKKFRLLSSAKSPVAN